MDIKTPLIVFQNSNIIAVDKPSGWLSVPSRTGIVDPRPVVGRWLEEHLSQKIWPIHRLDFEVSGLLVYAINAEVHRAANEAFEKHLIQKSYVAWAPLPAPLPSPGQSMDWRSTLAKGKKRAYEASFGKRAHTLAVYRGGAKFRGAEFAEWELNPLTGRSHQLRFEMAKHGFPILGDRLYGSVVEWVDERGIALRAVELRLSESSALEAFGWPQSLKVCGFEV